MPWVLAAGEGRKSSSRDPREPSSLPRLSETHIPSFSLEIRGKRLT